MNTRLAAAVFAVLPTGNALAVASDGRVWDWTGGSCLPDDRTCSYPEPAPVQGFPAQRQVAFVTAGWLGKAALLR